jgi:P27 family predicted phage terminase small subunit
MGQRGPRPVPTPLKVLTGVRKDRINDAEPIPSAEDVVRPSWLCPQACKVWDTKAPDLIRRRVLTTWDAEAFAVYCDAVVLHRQAAEHLQGEGAVVEADVFDRNGRPAGTRLQRNVWALAWKDTATVIQSYGARFGMTPSDRVALSVPVPQYDDRERLLS